MRQQNQPESYGVPIIPFSEIQPTENLNNKRDELWRQKEFRLFEIPEMQGCQNFLKIGTAFEYFSKYFPESHYKEVVMYTKMYYQVVWSSNEFNRG